MEDYSNKVKAHNDKVLASVPKYEACLCAFLNCSNCNRPHTRLCEETYTAFWSYKDEIYFDTALHRHIPRYKCKSSHKGIYANFKGSTCRKNACSGARLVISTWCASCFVEYKTSKGEFVYEDQLTPRPRNELGKALIEANCKALPWIIHPILELDELDLSRIIANFVDFV